jgi:hypothetical protein
MINSIVGVFGFILGLFAGHFYFKKKGKKAIDSEVKSLLKKEIQNFDKIIECAKSHEIKWVDRKKIVQKSNIESFGTLGYVLEKLGSSLKDEKEFTGSISLYYFTQHTKASRVRENLNPIYYHSEEFVNCAAPKAAEYFIFRLGLLGIKQVIDLDSSERWWRIGEDSTVPNWRIDITYKKTSFEGEDPNTKFIEVKVLKEVIDANGDQLVALLQTDSELRNEVLEKLNGSVA